MLNKILSNRLFHIICFFLLYVFLLFEYFYFVTAYFHDAGFLFHFNILKITVGLLLLLFVYVRIFVLPQPSDFIYALNLFISFALFFPAVIMFQIGGTTPFIPLFAVLFIYLLSSRLLQFSALKVRRIRYPEQKFILIGLSFVMLIPFVITYGFDIDTSVLSFGEELYKARATASLKSNVYTSYFLGPLTKVLLPTLIVYGLIRKQKTLWITGIIFMLYLFLVNPHKSIFFSIFIVLIFFFFENYKTKAGLMLSGFLILLISSVFFSKLTGNILPESIFVRRLFFLPVQISDNYFTFFKDNPMFLSHSFLSPFFDYPYHTEPALLIGEYMYQSSTVSCNTGIIADGFMNFGAIGSFAFVLFTSVFFRCIDTLKIHHSFFGLSLVFLVVFFNSAFFTTLLTHGGILFLLIGLLFLKNTKISYQ